MKKSWFDKGRAEYGKPDRYESILTEFGSAAADEYLAGRQANKKSIQELLDRAFPERIRKEPTPSTTPALD